MKPDVAARMDPKAMPAYLIFMAIRYEDHVEQEMRIYEIFELSTKAIKDVIRVSLILDVFPWRLAIISQLIFLGAFRFRHVYFVVGSDMAIVSAIQAV